MKKAYNKTWVENINNQEILDDWFLKKSISDQQHKEAYQAYPVGFHQSNAFVKIGLFIFTCIVAAAGLFFIYLIIGSIFSESRLGFSVISMIYSAIFLYFLEYLIKKNNFYRSGVDNALLYAFLSLAFSAVVGFANFDLNSWTYCFIALVILLPALIRYSDPIVAFVTYFAWISFWFILVSKYPIGKVIIPFVIMFISAITYFFIDFWKKKEVGIYYQGAQNIIIILTLATFYFGGNYLIVREGNALLNNLAHSIQIDFAPLFYLFSTIIPLCYVVYGLRKHDRKFLVVGIAASAFSVYTYYYYYSILPLEWALTIVGIFLVGLCIWAIRALRIPKFSLSSEAIGTNEYKNLEAFIVNQAIQQPHQTNKTDFGQGDFGGGGAGSGY
jgi:hypothetical protein